MTVKPKSIIRVANKTRSFKTINTQTNKFKNSFFVKTLEDWNHMEDSVVHADTVGGFKSALRNSTKVTPLPVGHIPEVVLLHKHTDTEPIGSI